MVPECQHMKPVGGKCGSPALKGKAWCYFHSPERLRPVRSTRVRYFLELPMPDSRAAVQFHLGVHGPRSLLKFAAQRRIFFGNCVCWWLKSVRVARLSGVYHA